MAQHPRSARRSGRRGDSEHADRAGAHQPQSQTAQGPNAKAAPDGRATQTGAFDTVATSAFQDQMGQAASILDDVLPQSNGENNRNLHGAS